LLFPPNTGEEPDSNSQHHIFFSVVGGNQRQLFPPSIPHTLIFAPTCFLCLTLLGKFILVSTSWNVTAYAPFDTSAFSLTRLHP
jgi:hypothetical protein